MKNLTAIISSEYIYKTPAERLFGGAVLGLNQALKQKKLPPIKLKAIQSRGDFEKAALEFAHDFYLVAAKHPQLLKEQFLQVQAVRGMLKTLDDPYTVYMDEKEFASLKDAMNGAIFGGVGILIELDKDNQNALTVVEPLSDSPAMRGGVRSRDVIIQIDDTPTNGITMPKAQSLLRGKIGSTVRLKLQRREEAEPIWVEVQRDQIRVSSVRSKLIEEGGIKVGYLKLTVFGEKSDSEMEGAIRELEASGARAFVLDVRNNGGGYIDAAVDICSKFLETGSKVVTVQERGQAEVSYPSRPNLHPWKPLVMLVNEYSASASEITAGAMQDLQRAKLVGSKTFGKGSVQKIFPLSDRSAMKVTTAHYHTPQGKDIHKKGIQPDLSVKMPTQKSATPEDPQLQAALKLAVEEVQALPASPVGDTTRVAASLEEEQRLLEEQRAQGYTVVKREFVRENDRLFEDITLEKAGESRRLRWEIPFSNPR